MDILQGGDPCKGEQKMQYDHAVILEHEEIGW